MKYDDASWHYGGNFPAGLPPEAGGVHIALFAVWAWANDLAGSLLLEDVPECLGAVRARRETPVRMFFKYCDEKLTNEDLNDEGNAFAQHYYKGEGDGSGQYFDDYGSTLGDDLPSLYHVSDGWESYDSIAPVISARFAAWRASRAQK
jgi:hypothetical protein